MIVDEVMKMDFLDYLNRAITPYHAVDTCREALERAGFVELSMGEEWDLGAVMARTGVAGFYTMPTDGMMYAWVVGNAYDAGEAFRLAIAHTDYPCLHVKPMGEMNSAYSLLDCEVYGGPILNTWLDRPLGIAGRAVIDSEDGVTVSLFQSETPVAVIPNLPIHFNRDVNKGVELKKSVDLRPLVGGGAEAMTAGWLRKFVAEQVGVGPDDILDVDAYLYNAAEASICGLNNDLLVSGRIDNQSSCYALLKGILNARTSRNVGLSIIGLFDNEEVGSNTRQGADSTLTSMLLEKIYDGLSMEQMRLREAIVKSRLLSLDVAHALHPNHPEKFDSDNSGKLGQGVVMKLSSTQRYAYEPVMVGEAVKLCRDNRIPYCQHVNHSDQPGGSTMGPIMAARLPMPAMDMGVPILAMHSASETMNLKDEQALVDFAKCFLEYAE